MKRGTPDVNPWPFESQAARLRPAGLALFAAAMALAGAHAARTGLGHPILDACAWAVVAACPPIAFFQARRALMRGIAVRVDTAGVHDRRLGAFTVPWSDIVGIDAVFRRLTISGHAVSRFTVVPLAEIENPRAFAVADGFLLRVGDAAPYRAATGRIERLVAWTRSIGDLDGIFVTAKDLAAPGAELAAALRTGLNTGGTGA